MEKGSDPPGRGDAHPESVPDGVPLRKDGFFTQGGWAFFGTSPNTDYTQTRQNNPKANPAPWLPPGHDGEKPAMAVGTASYGFGGIPSTVKDEARIKELLGILEYWAAPFGSDEFTFMYKGIEGQMFKYVDGAPVGVTIAAQNWANGLNYLRGPSQINYFCSGQPAQATLMHGLQEQVLGNATPDPPQGLYSPDWVQNAASSPAETA